MAGVEALRTPLTQSEQPARQRRFALQTDQSLGADQLAGRAEQRMAALDSVGLSLEAIDASVGSRVPVDDVLDAAAAAWTATRLLAGAARSLPDPPQRDASGRGIAIWV